MNEYDKESRSVRFERFAKKAKVKQIKERVENLSCGKRRPKNIKRFIETEIEDYEFGA